jgi:hypothetical protein
MDSKLLIGRLSLLLLLLGAVPARAQEAIALTVPVTRVSIANYTPGTLFLDIRTPRIIVQLVNTAGDIQEFVYPCAAPCAFATPASVTTMITALNTANLSTRSLWRRVFDRLVLDFPARFVGGATVQ